MFFIQYKIFEFFMMININLVYLVYFPNDSFHFTVLTYNLLIYNLIVEIYIYITFITRDIKEEKLIRFDDKYCLTFPVLKDIHFLHSTNGKRGQIWNVCYQSHQVLGDRRWNIIFQISKPILISLSHAASFKNNRNSCYRIW